MSPAVPLCEESHAAASSLLLRHSFSHTCTCVCAPCPWLQAFVAWLGHNSGLLCSPAGYHLLGAEFLRLQEVARVDTDPAYWPLLQRLVLTGQVELALQLLTAHPAYQALQDPDMAAKVMNPGV